MGDYFERIVDLEVTSAEAGTLAERMVDWMVSRRWLLRETSRNAMYSLQVDEGYVPGPDWSQITQDWGADWVPGPVAVIVGRHDHYPGQGGIEPASAVCPRCRATTVIIDYPQRWEADAAVWQPFSDAIDAWKKIGHRRGDLPLLHHTEPHHHLAVGRRLRTGCPRLRLLGLAAPHRGLPHRIRRATRAPNRTPHGQVLDRDLRVIFTAGPAR
ncbi:hypothetical protein [Nocardia amikacinitolerans]|uniref:hypothetical protein n=1 Tax=Nocardia amikacinitolerans TaxID=756689 RepID=UPI0020A5C3BE|nr:hypothetical protein [Nocardia amikacinitolerans]